MDARQTTRLKVTATYLSIIMLMSVVFSIVIYQISDHELYQQRNVPIPRNLRDLLSPDDFDNMREQRLSQSRENLRNRLIAFNLFTLLIGAGVSYILALKALEPIEKALERQDRFTSDASHEMRTPLTVMKSDIEISLRDKNLNLNDAKDTLKSNLEEVNKLEALTTNLLRLARQENAVIKKSKVNASDILQQAVNDVKKLADTKNIKIILPPKNNKIQLLAEPQSLKQAIVIFLDNAIKYSPASKNINIELKSQRQNNIIKITDQGQGIAEEDLSHIFDRFYRSDKSRTRSNDTTGYGLGLSIAKQIIDDHGGSIDIKSKLNKGTEVFISLPKKEV